MTKRCIKKKSDEATRARAKREGLVYQPGIGMAGGYVEDEDGAEDNTKKQRPPKKKPARKSAATGRPKACQCGGTDHQRTSSLKCALNPRNAGKLQAAVAVADVTKEAVAVDTKTEEERMAEELDVMDSLALNDSGADSGFSDDFYSANSEFSNSM